MSPSGQDSCRRPDGDIPGTAFSEAWQVIGPLARNALREDGRVPIHCRAGLGRTGLVAACLLIDFGAEPEDAIDAVRRARPNTIETRAQEAYVSSYTAPPERPDRESAIAGTLFGGAIGDAMGSAFEFLSAVKIERELGESFAWRYQSAVPGSLLSGHPAGMPTDDTAMALSVASLIASSNDLSPDSFAAAFLNDLNRRGGRFGGMFWNGGPGSATTQALARLEAGADPDTCGTPDAGGNGAAMRAHPIGVLLDRNHVLEIAAIQARVTHGHPAAVAAAQAAAVVVYDALAGLEPTLEPPESIVDPTFVATWKKAHAGLRRGSYKLPGHLLDVDMSGWATVAAAHAISWLFHDDPRRAIAAAAASGGDTDTIASIVGAFVGARHGIEALPNEWVDGLLIKDDLEKVAVRLMRAREDTFDRSRLASTGTIDVKGEEMPYVFREDRIIVRKARVTADFLMKATEAVHPLDPGRVVVVEAAL